MFSKLFEEVSEETQIKKARKQFATLLTDHGTGFNGNLFHGLDGWPQELDTENYEIEIIEPKRLIGWAGGDWQQEVWFAIIEKGGKPVIDSLFDGNFELMKQTQEEYTDNLKAIVAAATEEKKKK